MKHAPRILLLLSALLLPLHVVADEQPIDARLQAAESLYREEGPEKALPVFERLAAEFGERQMRLDEAVATHFVGVTHWRMGNLTEARKYLDRALALKRELGNLRQEAITLNVLGLLEWELGNYDQAKQKFAAASDVARRLGARKLEGATLNNLSLVYDELGDYRTSLTQYEQVLEIFAGANFERGQGSTLGNIGRVHLLLGNFEKALEYFERALAINEELGLIAAMSRDNGNVGLANLGLGDIDAAMLHLDRAIELSEQAGLQYDLAYWLGGKGNALVEKGHYDQGLAEYRKMLSIYESLDAHAELVEALHDMGQLHLLLGDPATAENYFSRAIDLARNLGRVRNITMNLLALGDLEFRRDRPEQANALYRQARRQSVKAGNSAFLALSLLRLSQVSLEQRRIPEAVGLANKALTLSREIAARSMQGEALFVLAEAARLDGDAAKAIALYADAEATLADIGDPEILWQIYYGRGRAYQLLGEPQKAVEVLTDAIRIIEAVRGRLSEKRFRTGYLQDKYQVYIDLASLQLSLGLTAEAFMTAERLRARSYATQLNRGGPPTFSDDDQRRAHALRERILQLQRALADEETRSVPERRHAAVSSFTAELRLAQQDYQALVDDLGGAGYANDDDRIEIPVTAHIQQQLLDDEVLLEYVVGDSELIVFTLTHTEVMAAAYPVDREDIGRRVKLLRDLVQSPESDEWQKPSAALASILIEPVAKTGWLNDARQIYIVPHGILNYLPFSVLTAVATDKDRLLIDEFAIAYLPTAAALIRELPSVARPQNLLAMAPAISRLRHAASEARSIDALYQPNSRLLLGSNATESRFKELAGDFRILHLATHGYFDKVNPMFSGVRLEPDEREDGLLEVHEVFKLELDADLVTLSACETALGSGFFAEVPAGDEFVGLTRAFLSVGSDAVMATLWEVDDRSSVDLMKDFYKRLAQPGVNNDKSAALAAAQKNLRSKQEYEHPFYWAPFILVGKAGGSATQQINVAEATL